MQKWYGLHRSEVHLWASVSLYAEGDPRFRMPGERSSFKTEMHITDLEVINTHGRARLIWCDNLRRICIYISSTWCYGIDHDCGFVHHDPVEFYTRK